ncbi:uncharacterized protein LOC123868875 [Maniola jurtina]|uniref:uncharacterized protein LOC123868875 n=1 Tax=Maniola jurtina TaxID=191418 RepID=UPI001E68C37A|nr:uncharacterized protein LOC123868875 [Maniola jurtina]
MNTVLTLLYSALVIISETNCFYIENTSYHEDFERQAVILRKLQNLQERDSRNATQTTSWSEILADVLVKEIFSYKTVDVDKKFTNKPPEKSTSVLVKTVSHVLEMYKTYVFDKLRSDYSNIRVNIEHTNETIGKNRIEKSVPEFTNTSNPKEDVELIEPKYHGKLKENGTLGDDSVSDCGEGFKRDEDGNCAEAKHSKFILSIPRQCPIGYRRDWLGYCRESL